MIYFGWVFGNMDLVLSWELIARYPIFFLVKSHKTKTIIPMIKTPTEIRNAALVLERCPWKVTISVGV